MSECICEYLTGTNLQRGDECPAHPRKNPLREKLAALEHEQWAAWTRYFLKNLTDENIARWRRQIETPYAELSEKEKESDRAWADRVLALIADKKEKT